MKRRLTVGDATVYILVSLIVLACILPFMHEIAKSFSHPNEVDAGRVGLFPRNCTFGNYLYFYRKQALPLLRSFGITIFITVVGTAWSLLISSLMAYPLSRPRSEFAFGPVLMGLVIFSMVFMPPIIPYFLAIKSYGLMDSLWAIILPHSIIPFHMIILVTFFRGMPAELIDSCKIDGAGPLQILYRMVLPLSTAALATIGIFTAIILWNIFLNAILFIQTPEKVPLQIFMRSIFAGGGDVQRRTLLDLDFFSEAESMKSALVILTTLPIALIYPFLQRFS